MTASPVTASSGAAFADVARSLGNPRREELRLDVGERIRDFTILECLGLGGFGNVYRVRRDGADKEIALKILRPGARVPERFEREIDILTTTRHSSIVVVFERGEAEVPTDGGLRRVRYFTMELVRRTLHASIQDTTAEERSKLEYVKAVAERMAGVADALAHLHDKNVFHRDINPSNVGECEGCYKLFDFGLAKARDDREVRTLTDHVLGTLPYIPPEQFSGSRTELFAQLDLYCLTATLYEVVTGRPPFYEVPRDQLLAAIRSDRPQPELLNPVLPDDLIEILRIGLEKDPAHRFRSAAQMADALRDVAAGKPLRVRRVGVIRRVIDDVKSVPLRLVIAWLLTSVLVVVASWIAPRLGGGAEPNPESKADLISPQQRRDLTVNMSPYFRALDECLETEKFGKRISELVPSALSLEVRDATRGQLGVEAYFRTLLVGYVLGIGEDLDVIEYNCLNQESTRSFTLNVTRRRKDGPRLLADVARRIDRETHDAVFAWLRAQTSKHESELRSAHASDPTRAFVRRPIVENDVGPYFDSVLGKGGQR